MNEEAKRRLSEQLKKLEETTDNISSWNKVVPALEGAKRDIRWAIRTLENSPNLVDYPELGDPFIKHLIASEGTISELLTIPTPFANAINISGAVGQSSASLVMQWVDSLKGSANNDPSTSEWIRSSEQEYEEITDRQTRSEVVKARLKQLSDNRKIDLVALYEKAYAATMVAVANVGNSSDAATLMRDLLDDFKENLLSRCRPTKVPPQIYHRIANGLAITTPVTHQAICNGESTHKKLHDEMSQVLKLKLVIPTMRLSEILHELEDHIWIVTESIDPSKIMIKFIR
jgi:hypothetical protein